MITLYILCLLVLLFDVLMEDAPKKEEKLLIKSKQSTYQRKHNYHSSIYNNFTLLDISTRDVILVVTKLLRGTVAFRAQPQEYIQEIS